MNDELFEQVKSLSLEIRSLIRQGVKNGVDERIQQRNTLLQEWFAGISQLIQITNEQQSFLEQLLKDEKQLVTELQLEQSDLARQQSNRKKAGLYRQH